MHMIQNNLKIAWPGCKKYFLNPIPSQFFNINIAKLVPVGYGINKLQISCVVEDDKVCLPCCCCYGNCIVLWQIGTDFLEEAITAFEDLVQSMDVAAFNKV